MVLLAVVWDIGNLLAAVAAFAAVVGGAYGFFRGLKQYKEGQRNEQLHWLAGQFEKFYETANYNTVRDDLDWNDGQKIAAAIASQGQPNEREVERWWTNYLNFFEMLAHLTFHGAVTEADTETVFGYWLRQIGNFQPVRDGYLRDNGYEQLAELLTRLESK